jgi:hypothetical protein
MPAVPPAATPPAFVRVGDAVVRADDPRAAAAQQLVHDRAQARRRRAEPIPIPGRPTRPPSPPPRGPAMARLPRESFVQFDAPVRSVVQDGAPVAWTPPPDPGPPPPIYQQTADHLLIDLRPGPHHAARADLYPEEDTVSQHRLDQPAGEVAEFPAGPPGAYSATPPDEHADYVYTDPTMDTDAVRITEPGDVDPDAFPDGWAGQPTERDAAAIVAGNA